MNHEKKKIANVLCKFRGKMIRRLIDLILLHVSYWMKPSGSCHSKSHFLALAKGNSADEMLSLGLDEFESLCCCSVTKSCLTLWSQGLQHAWLPCPSPSTGTRSNSCMLSQWCHPTISSSLPFSSCLQSFPASGSFLMGWLFTSGGQSIGASALASFFLMDIQISFL